MRRLLFHLFSCLIYFPVVLAFFTGIDPHHVRKRNGVPVFWETTKRARCQPPSKGSAVVSLFASSSIAPIIKGTTNIQQEEQASNKDLSSSNKINEAFQELCREVHPKPPVLLRLDESANGIRGVFVQRSVPEGEVILSIPLTSCLRDDNPPAWMPQKTLDDDDDDEDGYFNPSAWATRLAASLLDLQLGHSSVSGGSNDENTNSNNNNNKSLKLWLDLLPNANLLRASLPIHWSEETLQSAQCSALELAVDTAFFARAQAREEVMQALNEYSAAYALDEETKRRLSDNALDLVQTRSCRVLVNTPSDTSESDDPQPVRLLAPVFDFINHPSQGKANAGFALEGTELVVRSLRHLEANVEVLIDYGESARPAWRCLSSYGFVPTYERGTGEGDDELEEGHVGEVFVNGVRYQVGPSSVPQEMVAAMAVALNPTLLDCDEEEIVLTKEVAIKLGQRIAEDAFHKLLDPPSSPEIVEDDDDNNDDELQTPEQILSSRQAAALRFYQHRVLMDCSLGLRDWAMQQT